MIYLTLTNCGYILSEDRLDEYGLTIGPFDNHEAAWNYLDRQQGKAELN